MPFRLHAAVEVLRQEAEAQAETPENTAMLPEQDSEPEQEPESQEAQEAEPTQPMDLPEQAPAEPPEESEATEDVQESEQEEMDLPEQAPDEEVPAVDQAEDATTEDSAAAMEVPEREEVQPGEAGWEELLTEFDPPAMEEQKDDPYARAMADVDWKMVLQSRSEALA